ncbi:MFS transporter [Reyranella sp.]|uniref:MFS transporter n=1 Tax=Reyranella sp. TaxID=1929291 RepID=UPI003783A3FC
MTTSWRQIGLLYAIGVVAAGQLGVVPPLVTALQRDLELSLTGAGIAVSAITLVGAVLGLPAGGWSERIGHVRALRLGLAVMGIAAVMCGLASDGTVLLAARCLAGAGYLLVVVAAPSLMAAASAPRHQSLALSVWGTFVPTGIALAGLATAVLADRVGWRTIFLADAVLLAGGLGVTALMPRQASAPASSGTRPASPASVPIRAAPLALAFFCFALLFLALAGLLPAYLVDMRGLPTSEAGQFVAIATSLGILGSLATGWTMQRGTSPGRLIVAGTAASTALAALGLFIHVPVHAAIACFALSFAVGGLVPAAVFASVPLVAPEPRVIGPINGLVAQTGSLGSLAGPPVLALWVEQFGWTSAATPLLAVAALGIGCALAVRRA